MGETTDERTTRDCISFLRTLRAVRSFRPDPVPQEVIDDILEVARWSGSASNRQPWEMIVVRERETLRSLASVDGYAGHLARAPLGIVLVMGGDRAEQETYDEGRLAERIMLAAHAHGVGIEHRLDRRRRQGRGQRATRHTPAQGGADRDLPRLPRRGSPQTRSGRGPGPQTHRRDRAPESVRLGELMSSSFDPETLSLLDETEEVYIETRRDADSPEHRTIIWVVVVGGEVFVRSVRGPKGRWYQRDLRQPRRRVARGRHPHPRARRSRHRRHDGQMR